MTIGLAVLLLFVTMKWMMAREQAQFWHERADDWYEYGRAANQALRDAVTAALQARRAYNPDSEWLEAEEVDE